VHQRYEGPWSDLVYHSGRVLQSLMYQPTGAIVAAPTTSLPESEGGERNWDYRYAWVRDASFTLDALWVAACPDEANKFFSWMTGTVASQIEGGSDLQIMFGIGGEHDLSERQLPHFSGWRDSRPVRVGNGAWNQRPHGIRRPGSVRHAVGAAPTPGEPGHSVEPVDHDREVRGHRPGHR
jgi:GH15 family glucan-1,4-alpha-glucosidase